MGYYNNITQCQVIHRVTTSYPQSSTRTLQCLVVWGEEGGLAEPPQGSLGGGGGGASPV